MQIKTCNDENCYRKDSCCRYDKDLKGDVSHRGRVKECDYYLPPVVNNLFRGDK